MSPKVTDAARRGASRTRDLTQKGVAKGRAATRTGLAKTRDVTRVGVAKGRDASRRAGSAARTRSAELTASSRAAAEQIVHDHGPELRASLWRLRKVRSPQEALRALEDELQNLLTVAAPVLVEHPLPVRRAGTARVVVGTTAAAVAIGEGLDEVAALFSAGTSITPSLPALVAAAFLSVVVETAVATSLRVHDLRAAGIEPDPEQVADDVILAMAGGKKAARGAITRQLLNRVAARVLSRWGAGLVPVVGAVYSAWDAQKTIGAIRAIPLTGGRRVVPVTVDARSSTVLPPTAPA